MRSLRIRPRLAAALAFLVLVWAGAAGADTNFRPGIVTSTSFTATGFVNTQNLTITSGHFRPSVDNTSDIGTSTVEFRNAYFDGTVSADGMDLDSTLTTNNLTATGYVAAQNFTITAASGGAFRTGTNNVNDIGTTGNRFRSAYFGTTVTSSNVTTTGYVVTSALTITGSGTIRAGTDNGPDIGTASAEFKDAYFDGEVKADTVTVDEKLTTASFTATGASDLYRTMSFNITNVAVDAFEWARWTTPRAIKIKRGYMSLWNAPVAGTIGVTLVSGSASMSLASSSTRTVASTTDFNVAAGSDIRLMTATSGATNIVPATIIFQYQDN